ncbi:DUF4367 domain-containing protein [Marinicrinis lubricantis]|uniref:DUF4367 domain-containing protein n=1 Tax=Marinicrinis lubricantis TaxID=2086470 RepID=A0ABW1IKQ8_9BACL
MRKITVLMALVICVSAFLAGCGSKSANDVVGDLGDVVNDLNSYYASGVMTIHTSQEPQKYEVEVSYQKPEYYRIALTNMEKDISQIVLRNDEGVFILTPHLKKSFRFQSEWPKGQGQVYLYQTLADSIIQDGQRQFTKDDEHSAYVFDVTANYQNSTLARQKIWLDQKSYAAKRVEIADSGNQVLVELEFNQFEFDKKFEASEFDMQHNLTSYELEVMPTMGEIEDDGVEEQFGVIMPAYTPEGVLHNGVHDLEFGEQMAVMLDFTGEYNYTIVESRPMEQTVDAGVGKLVDIGGMQGVMTGDEKKMLRWFYDGIEFKLSSADLPESEMVKIAESVQGQIGK